MRKVEEKTIKKEKMEDEGEGKENKNVEEEELNSEEEKEKYPQMADDGTMMTRFRRKKKGKFRQNKIFRCDKEGCDYVTDHSGHYR